MTTFNPLSLWRTKSAAALCGKAYGPGVRAALLKALEPRNFAEHRLVRTFERQPDDHAAPFTLATLLASAQRGEDEDVLMSLVLVSALGGHQPAVLALAQALADRAETALWDMNHFLRLDGSYSDGGTGELAEVQQKMRLSRRLALSWGGKVQTSVLYRPDEWSKAFAATTGMAPAAGATAAEVPSCSAQPVLTVVAAIGDPDSKEGKTMASTYRTLTEPLALKGGDVDPAALKAALLAEFPNFAAAIDRLCGDLALRRRAGVTWARFRPLCLLGNPGIGKSRFAKRVASLLGTGYGEVPAAGSSDNRALQGTARGWSTAQPALPLLVMQRHQCANPVLLVDEVDKAGTGNGQNGDIRHTLLTMLEGDTARSWHDEALLAPADLSQISWILTANSLEAIPGPLRNRMGVVRIDPPGAGAFDGILAAILRDLATELGVEPASLPELGPAARKALAAAFRRGVPVRSLKNAVTSALAVEGAPRAVH